MANDLTRVQAALHRAAASSDVVLGPDVLRYLDKLAVTLVEWESLTVGPMVRGEGSGTPGCRHARIIDLLLLLRENF